MVAKKATDADIVRVLADPDTKSIKDAAGQLGVKPDTLYKRLSDNSKLWDMVREAVTQAVKTEVGPIWQGLIRAAKRGDVAAADRVLKKIGEYEELPEQRRVVELDTNMSDEEFAELAKHTADRISEKE